MKRTYVLAILAVAAFFAMSGIVMADIPVNATPETKGITVTTNVNTQGTVTASDSLTWQQSSDALDAPPLIPGGVSVSDSEAVEGSEYPSNWQGGAFGNDPYGWFAENGLFLRSGEVQYTAGYT